LEIVSVDDEVELTVHETRFLTDELRRQAAGIVPKDYSIMSRDQLISALSGTKENFTSSGYIEIGKALKSDYITYGSVGKLGNVLTLNIGLYETSSGVLLGEIVGESPDLKGLLEVIRQKSPNMFAKLKKDEQITVAEPTKEEVKTIPANVPAESKIKTSTFVAIGLDVLGVAALGIGMYQNSQMTNHYDDYLKTKDMKSYDKASDAQSSRNIFYIAGGVLLLSGIGVHIFF